MIGEFYAGLVGVFAFGTLWFWVLLAALTILMIGLTENEKGLWATVSIVGTLLLLQWLGDIKVFTFTRDNLLWAVLYFAGYVLIGTAWTVCKWWFYVRNERARYDELKAGYVKNHLGDARSKTDPGQDKERWKEMLKWSRIEVRPQGKSVV